MTVTAVGEITVLAAMPPAVTPLVSASADLDAEIAALANFTVTPPSIKPDLDVASELTAGLTLTASLGITPPSIEAQLSITLALLAELKLELELLQGLMGLMATSAHVYAYAGTVGSFGTEMQAELSGGLPAGSGSDVGFAVTFIATAPAAVTALQSLFKHTP